MEIKNVSKAQQPDKKTENSQSPPIGLQLSEKNPKTGGGLQLAPKQNVY